MSDTQNTAIAINSTAKFVEQEFFHITTEHGAIEVIYRENIGQYMIANFDVGKPRQGIGKELLRASLRHAQELKASYMVAAIISRECLQSMMSIFGEEAVEVYEPGSYGESGTTSAALFYHLEQD